MEFPNSSHIFKLNQSLSFEYTNAIILCNNIIIYNNCNLLHVVGYVDTVWRVYPVHNCLYTESVSSVETVGVLSPSLIIVGVITWWISKLYLEIQPISKWGFPSVFRNWFMRRNTLSFNIFIFYFFLLTLMLLDTITGRGCYVRLLCVVWLAQCTKKQSNIGGIEVFYSDS